MPAITLGLAEIEERLRALRWRLNAVAVQHGAYLSASVLVLVVAGLLFLALRGSAPAFRLAAWTGAAISLGVIAACALFLHRRWLDSQATAHLVDRRAQLTDRLATAIDLRLRPRPSRLAPVLVAQTLGLGTRWQLQQLAPRRVPRSVFVLLASILVLALTAFTVPREPSSESPPAVGGTFDSAGVPAELRLRSPGANASAGGESAAGGTAVQRLSSTAATGAADTGTESTKSADGAPAPRPDGALASLPDRLQGAIQKAFRGEALDKPRALAAHAESGVDGSGNGTREGSEPKTHRASAAGRPTAAGASPQAPGQDSRTAPGESASGEHAGERQNPTLPSGDAKGSSTGAGDGSSPNTLMGAQTGLSPGTQAEGLSPGGDGPKTFKLTITSFLRAAEQQGPAPHAFEKPTGASASGGPTGNAPAALNDRQLNDDALRKAEVPPEYEDIVRRVYSAKDQ